MECTLNNFSIEPWLHHDSVANWQGLDDAKRKESMTENFIDDFELTPNRVSTVVSRSLGSDDSHIDVKAFTTKFRGEQNIPLLDHDGVVTNLNSQVFDDGLTSKIPSQTNDFDNLNAISQIDSYKKKGTKSVKKAKTSVS